MNAIEAVKLTKVFGKEIVAVKGISFKSRRVKFSDFLARMGLGRQRRSEWSSRSLSLRQAQ